jgi:hypothetical protein|tara:strand:- start:594 stop:812 length:219 start_codon:yes stop_codon:yes gene_type:complete
MPEMIIALLMIINGEIKEARIQTSMSECLKGSRVAKRQLKPNSKVKYQCIKSMAELEDNIDGSRSIKKLILE